MGIYAVLLFLFVGFATVVALRDWRLGLFLCVVVGCLQDPVRKVTPGNPAYLVLMVFPIYAAMAVSIWSSRPALKILIDQYPQTLVPAQLFFLSLIVSSLQTLTYGLSTAPIVVLGLSFYGGWVPAVVLGFFFLRRSFAELDFPLVVLAGVISLMLIGVPLEYADVKFSQPWLGMVAMKGEWRHWYSNTEYVRMLSGFYRAPEIMAWHGATLACVSLYLLVRRPRLGPVWLTLIAWGLACVALSGRRKMFVLVLLFAALFILFTEGRWRGRLLVCVLLGALGVGGVLVSTVDERYLEAAGTAFTHASPRVTSHTYSGPLWLLGIVGPFGYGVGTKTQGAQHLSVTIETPLIEGGLEKMLVELGFVGTTAAILLALTLFRVVYRLSRRLLVTEGDTTPLAALLAFLAANLMAFSIAYQVYGDPLIGILLGFSLGLILSASRLATQHRQQMGNGEWGMRNGKASSPTPPSSIPHSPF